MYKYVYSIKIITTSACYQKNRRVIIDGITCIKKFKIFLFGNVIFDGFKSTD